MSDSNTISHITIRVRYVECDPMGVAHHAAFPVWLEMGRTELYRQTGHRYRDLEDRGLYLAVVSLAIKYRKSTRYDDLLELETRVVSTGRVKLQHEYAIYCEGELIATAESTLACVDRNGALQPLPEEVLHDPASN